MYVRLSPPPFFWSRFLSFTAPARPPRLIPGVYPALFIICYDSWNNIPYYTQLKLHGRGPCEPSLTSYYVYVCCMICDISINQLINQSFNQSNSKQVQSNNLSRKNNIKNVKIWSFLTITGPLGPLDRPIRGPQPLVLCLSNSAALDEGSWIDN